jgi:hypothetical protein
MKFVYCLSSQVLRMLCSLILGISFTQSVSLAQEPDTTQLGLFWEVELAFEKSRAEEVPTYAPDLFAKAVELYKRAQRDWQKRIPIEQVRKQTQLAMETLGRSKDVSKVSKESLSQVVETRIQINQNELVRYHSPKKLNEAERHYRQAIRQAEIGDIDAARRSAANAQNIYREATLQALEMTSIKNLENQLKYSEKFLPRKRYNEAARKLSELRKNLNKAKTGEITISELRAKIAVAGGEISQSIALKADFGLNTDFLPSIGIGPGPLLVAPGTYEPPVAPRTMRITERTANTCFLTWKDNSAFEEVNLLEHQEGDGPWEVAAEFGPLSGWQEYEDVDLNPDTRYCYCVKVENSFGTNVTPQPQRACVYTRDGNNLPVWRAQFKIRIADIPDAGTEDDVCVRLQSPLVTYSPNGNATWLDYGPRLVQVYPLVWLDDFARGREFTYDLGLDWVRELSDVSMISIKKDGSDALGIAELALVINGKVVFEKYFGETASTCQWIDQGDGYSPVYTIFHSELRAHEKWQGFIDSPIWLPPALTISNEHIVSLLESTIGNAIHGSKLYWDHLNGSEWVEATKANDSTLHVDLDLAADVSGPNPEVDIDFDLKFKIECDNETGTATLNVTTLNFNPNAIYDWFDDVVTLGIVEFFDDDIEDDIEASFDPITKSIILDTGGLCPRVEVSEDGRIRFIAEL